MEKASALAKLAGGSEIRLYSFGRHALVAALRASGVSSGDRVLIPSFVCRDLLASIHAVGATPAFYGVDRSLNPQALPSVRGAKAVVAINYFGFPQDLEPFRAYCAANGGTLIEDNAHGFLGCDATGAPLGSRGDFGILSFRKTFPLPDGAALLINRGDLAGSIPPSPPCSDRMLPATYLGRRFLGRIQGLTGVRVRGAAEQVVRRVRRWKSGHEIAPSLPESEVLMPGEAAIHCASVRILEKVDAPDEVRRRRRLFERFQGALHTLDLEPVFGEVPAGVSPYGYAFRSTDTTAEAVAGIAGRMGFECVRWPDLPAAVVTCAPEHYRNVRWVNFLC